MPEKLQAPMATPIVSPCVHICKLNAQQECSGCGRLLEEIAQWRAYSDSERQTIMERVQKRQQEKPSDKNTAVETPVWEEKHERVRCQRCAELFDCKVNSPTRCDCMEVRLTPNEMEHILLMADGECVCPNCLEQLRAEYHLLHGV